MENSKIKNTIKQLKEFTKHKDIGRFKKLTQQILHQFLLVDDYNYSSKRELVATLNDISLFFGDFKADEKILLKLLEAENKKKAPNQDYTAFVINLLGELYYYKGEFALALEFYQKALDIRMSLYDDSHPDTIESFSNLALVLIELGRFSEAEEIFNRSLKVYESKISGHIEDYIKTLWNTGLLYQYWGKYSLSMEKYLTALEISQLNGTKDLTDSIENNLGVLCLETGNYQSAEEYLQKSSEYTQNHYGINHPKAIITLNNLVSAQMNLGKLEKAEKGFYMLQKAQRNNMPIISLKIKINYAVFLIKKNEQDNALTILEECLEVPSTPEIQIKILSNISKIHILNKEPKKAHDTVKKAIAHQKNHMGQRHIHFSKLLGLLAQIHVILNKKEEAFKILKKAAELQNDVLMDVSTNFSKDYAWNFLQKISGELNQLLSLFFLLYKENSSDKLKIQEYMQAIFEILLRRKAVVFDAGVERFNQILKKGDPHLKNLFETLMKTKEEIVLRTTKNYFSETPQENKKKVMELNAKAEILENRISNLVPIYQLELKIKQATLAILKNKISANTLFVDIFKFRFFDFFLQEAPWQNDGYIIFYISKDKTNFMFLEDSEEIDQLIKKTDSNNIDFNRGVISRSTEDQQEQTSEPSLRKLYDILFKHQTNLEDSEHQSICISPDGGFFNLPFESLICKNGRYLIENYRVQYVNSGRQFIYEKSKGTNSNDAIMIFADPSFELEYAEKSLDKKKPKKIKHSFFRSELNQFPQLPGTASEANEIYQILKKKNIQSVSIYNHESVNDGELKKIVSPKILHFATHGFYLENRVDIHPFSRCGIALSGINNILRGEEIPLLFEDGMLTGMDVLSLNLLDTDIVVLSACKTGRGEINLGEGVMGLCSALISAGVSSVMVSLWNVPDAFTVELMSSFYEYLALGLNKSEALKRSKEAMINTLRAQWGEAPSWIWGGFILYGDDSAIRTISTDHPLKPIIHGENN